MRYCPACRNGLLHLPQLADLSLGARQPNAVIGHARWIALPHVALLRTKSGKGEPEAHVPCQDMPTACAALERWARTANLQPGDQVFRAVDKGQRIAAERLTAGSVARIAMQLMLYCGSRRGDVVALGRQHCRNGRLRYTQQKNRAGKPSVVDIAMPAALQRVLGATQAITGDLTFLVTEYGRPFSVAGFGNKFRGWCVEAGVPGRSHGLRKAAATRVAENRGTVDELKAIFGWKSKRPSVTAAW
jgi:integrase